LCKHTNQTAYIERGDKADKYRREQSCRRDRTTPVRDKSLFFHVPEISTNGKFDRVSNGSETDPWTISLLNKGGITARRPS
jgi:hypothetical protein